VTDLWDAAGEDHEVLAKQAAHALADAELEAVLPFLLASRTPEEFAHRSGLAQDSIRSIAARCGLDEAELLATAQRRYDLMREALQEGQNILDETVEETHGEGSGPEKPVEHDTSPDFSHGYSEVPAGPPGGPDPQVVQVRPPMMAAPQAGHEAARTAAADPESMMTQPYGGASSGMSSANMPAGTGSGASSGPAPDLTPAPDEATTGGLEDLNTTTAAVRDPVRRKVMQVAASIRASNPHLPDAECQRVARRVVGRYLQADLNSSVMGTGPVDDPQSQGGDGQGEGHGMSGFEEYSLGRGLLRAAPEMLAAL
jgi:hypothetical protein